MFRYKLNSFAISVLFAVSCGLVTAGAASAQNAFRPLPVKPVEADLGVEIERKAIDLQPEIRPRPIDEDVADTALVFTNLGSRDQRVKCVGFDDDGRSVGRIWLKLPAHGLRYALASDVSGDRDFIGSVQCAAGANVVGSVVFLGPDLTDLPVHQPHAGQGGRIRFPLVATY